MCGRVRKARKKPLPQKSFSRTHSIENTFYQKSVSSTRVTHTHIHTLSRSRSLVISVSLSFTVSPQWAELGDMLASIIILPCPVENTFYQNAFYQILSDMLASIIILPCPAREIE